MFWKAAALIKRLIKEIKKDNVGAYACQAAFFVIVSFIPFMILFISLIQYTPITEGNILTLVRTLLPSYVSPLMVSIISEVFTKSVGIVSVAAITAVWSAAKGVQYLTTGLNGIFDLKETRRWVILRIRAIGYTLLFLVVIVVMLVLLVFGNFIQHRVSGKIPMIDEYMTGMIGLRPLVLLILLILFFVILFKALPNRKVSMLSQLPGAVLAAVGWYGLSFGISIYVDYFNGFSMYGSLTTLVLIMLWVYFCMYILLVCAEINFQIGEWFAAKVRSKGLRRKGG